MAVDHRIVRSIIGGLREVDRSGFELWRWIGSVHGHSEALTEANLYPTLHRLEAERLIIGKWQDTFPTRRVYRIAARGSDMAMQRGWPAVVRRVAPAPPSIEPAADQGGSSAEAPPPAAGVEEYLDRLVAGLRLCEPERRSVRSEIEDHLRDAAAELRKEGVDGSKAETAAMVRLGPPETLAESISRAQLNRRRLLAGIPPAAYVAGVDAALGTAAGAGCLLVVQPVMRELTSLALLANVHLYVPETGQWHDQQLIAALWVGAFMAGRISLRRLANETRRHEAAISRGWMIGVGLLLLAVALLIPVMLDPAVVVGLLGLPVAFVVGCRRYQKIGDDPISRQGVAAAAAILLPFVLLPGIRVWVYDPAQGTALPPAAFTSQVSVSWERSQGELLASVEGVDTTSWHDVQLEFWPAVRRGPFVVPDPSASGPLLIAGTDLVRPSAIKDPPADYWVAVTAVANDGQRRTIHVEVHQSDRRERIVGLLPWLLGSP